MADQKKKLNQLPPDPFRRPQKPRDKGLWFSNLAVKVVRVKPAHKVLCVKCGRRPLHYRTQVVFGSGSNRASCVLCEEHAKQYFELLGREAQRAIAFLDGEVDCVREIATPDADAG